MNERRKRRGNAWAYVYLGLFDSSERRSKTESELDNE